MFAFVICYVVLLPDLIYYVDFGEGFLWLFHEMPTIILLTALLVVPAQILIYITLSLLIRAYIYLSTIAGKDDKVSEVWVYQLLQLVLLLKHLKSGTGHFNLLSIGFESLP